MIVTHQVNDTAMMGHFISSGEVFVLSVDESGDAFVAKEILISP